MTNVVQFKSRKFLLDFAERLREEWKEGENNLYSSKLTTQIAILEETSKYNNCVYSLFDFEKYTYLFYTQNLFDLIGLSPQAKEKKWDHAYLSAAQDLKPVEKFLTLRENVLAAHSDALPDNFQSAIGGCYITNLQGIKMRLLYRSRPISFTSSGNVKISFDCVSNITNLMVSEPGYWIRFTLNNKSFCWHNNNKKLLPKDIISPREAEFITLWNSGLSIPEIAQKSHVSIYTVKNQLANARKRMFARDNTSLARICSLIGVLPSYF